MAATAALGRVDHLVYGADDLERGIAEIEALLGVRAARGGRHAQWGTCNALLALGDHSYLEIVAPDADLPAPAERRPFGLGSGAPSRLVAWAANETALEGRRTAAAEHGVMLGSVQPGSRRLPDGAQLRWQLTDLRCLVADGVVPFLIDWGTTPHPALSAPQGAVLAELRLEHPDAVRVRSMLRVLGVDVPVASAQAPAIVAGIDCPRGRIALR